LWICEFAASATFDQLGNMHAAYSCTAAGSAHCYASVTMIGWLHANPCQQRTPGLLLHRPYAPLLPEIVCTSNHFWGTLELF